MTRLLLLGVVLSLPCAGLAYDPNDCMHDAAEADKGILVGMAVDLCAGAWSPAPVECYRGASTVDPGIMKGIAIDLCAGSVDAKRTLACCRRAASQGMIRGLATKLCGARTRDHG